MNENKFRFYREVRIKLKENKYDDEKFFNQYKKMARSTGGLEAAGEWHEFRKMMPDFQGKRVLDLGCGFGWHCRYAADNGAKAVTGIDISEKMLEKAKEMTESPVIEYILMPVEEVDYPSESFDAVLSSLTFHYIDSFRNMCKKIYNFLTDGGYFVFSVEHPIFTAYGTQDWYYGKNEERLHWPVDRYFSEGLRKANFLGEEVMKYHKTLTTYINDLIWAGFEITGFMEPKPEESMLRDIPEMQDELRRPMMLLISAKKRKR